MCSLFFSKKRRSDAKFELINSGFVTTTLLLLNAVHCWPSSSLDTKNESSKVFRMTEELASSDHEESTNGYTADQNKYSSNAELSDFNEEYEEMQDDQPKDFFNDTARANNRELLKEQRVTYIKWIVESHTKVDLSLTRIAAEYSKILTKCNVSSPSPSRESGHFKSGVLRPSCSFSEHTKVEEPSANKDINLRFSLSEFEDLSSFDDTINVISAILRLPAKLKENDDHNRDSGTMKRNASENTASTQSPNLKDENKKINVTIHYFRRHPQKKREVEKVKVDSKMLNVNDEHFTDWNIIKIPEKLPKNNNFNITISVRDERGQLLPARHFFSKFDCSKLKINTTVLFAQMRCLKNSYDSMSKEGKENFDGLTQLPLLEIQYQVKKKKLKETSTEKRQESPYNAGSLLMRNNNNPKNTTSKSQTQSTKLATK